MRRLPIAASLVLAVFVAAAGARWQPGAARPYCHNRLFTVAEGKRAGLVIYRGTRKVTMRNLRTLGQIERCQRNPWAQAYVRSFDRQAAVANRARWRASRVQAAFGGWAIPTPIVMCESGGRNLPPNSAGASGYYQIIVSTWARFGGYSEAWDAPKAVQDAKAAQLWDGGHGAYSQWVCAHLVAWR